MRLNKWEDSQENQKMKSRRQEAEIQRLQTKMIQLEREHIRLNNLFLLLQYLASENEAVIKEKRENPALKTDGTTTGTPKHGTKETHSPGIKRKSKFSI